jgi:DsbC/DsbD-like thiol-disulfide interchange protein
MRTRTGETWLALFGTLAHPIAADQSPVEWNAHLEPVRPRAGVRARIVVRAVIRPGWHIYPIAYAGPGTPTKLELMAHPAIRQDGSIRQAEPSGANLTGRVSFIMPVKLSPRAQGDQKATVSVTFQACDATVCLRPQTVQVVVTCQVSPPPAADLRSRKNRQL